MRVLHIDTGKEMRGGQWQVLHLIQGLAEKNHTCQLLAPNDSPLFRAASSLRLGVHPLRALTAPFAAGPFDLIHAHDAHAHTIGALSLKPLIVSRRVAFPIHSSPLSSLKYRRATHYLAVSEFVKSTLTSAGVFGQKISVVYDGVRIPDRNGSEDRPLVVALDSRDPGKGKAIVEAASEISGVPVHFSDQLLRDLPRAALFLYITELEGLGSAALLAMAYGAPVIASRVGGLPEVVEEGVTGVLTDNAPKAVARAVQRLLHDRPFASRMAVRARQRVERHFSVSHMVEGTLRAYERVLGA